jgi:hypothetical protein
MTQLFALLLFLAPGITPPSHAQPGLQPFSLTLTVPQTVSNTVRVDVVLTNISDKDIVVLQCNEPNYDYRVDVQSLGGARLTETDLGHRIKDKSLAVCSSAIRTVLKPKQAVRDEILVSDLYRIDSPGQYVVRVFRDVPEWMGSKGTVKSEPVTLTVTNGQHPAH